MIRKTLFAALLAVLSAGALAAVSPEEAAQLGKSLTPTGAEKAGNKDGTIPEWTGGLTTPPAGFQPGSGLRPDPYAAEKPRLVITGKNADQYKDQLTAVTLALLKRYPTMRVDVYPTHRPYVQPKKLQENTAKNALQAKTVEGGLGLENALPGVPFPMPKTGFEAMWNHLVRYQGVGFTAKYDSFNVDSSGGITLATSGELSQEWPPYDPKNLDKPMKATDVYNLLRLQYTGPARRAGEALMLKDAINPLVQPRLAWQYLPGQRRVKLAPDIAYDTPNPGMAGADTYDDAFIFNGAMDRFDFKLIGKREMIVPYDDYKLVYAPGSKEKVAAPNHVNPDMMRWELHRVWVVESTLKSGKRHVYQKRVFYIDEDSWTALASDMYDARGQLYRGGFAPTAFNYDASVLATSIQLFYDLNGGYYGLGGCPGFYYGIKYREAFPAHFWSPDELAGSGVR